jgi:hypothetical protein
MGILICQVQVEDVPRYVSIKIVARASAVLHGARLSTFEKEVHAESCSRYNLGTLHAPCYIFCLSCNCSKQNIALSSQLYIIQNCEPCELASNGWPALQLQQEMSSR